MGWRPPKHHDLAKLFLSGLVLSFVLYLVYLLSYTSVASSSSRTSPLSFLQPIALDNARSFPDFSPRARPKKEQGWVAPLQKRLTKRAAIPVGPPTSIPITDILPSTIDLTSSPLLRIWDDAFNSLSTVARDLTASSVKRAGLAGRMKGVPGTAIDEDDEAKALQEHLDCMSGRGEWVFDAEGAEREESGRAGLTVHKQEGIYATCEKRFYKGKGSEGSNKAGAWDVRNSLKWRWVPSSSCAATSPAGVSSSSTLSRRQFCTLLAHKSTLVVGDTPQYSLHDLLLDWTSLVPQSCYGDLYCKEHALCGDVLRSKDIVEDWIEDERVFNRLPLPPTSPSSKDKRHVSDDSQFSSPPHTKRKLDKNRSPSYGTLLRYRRADGLRPTTAQTLPTYSHPTTGVREINQQWVADSRRSDLVILSKPPLPLPARGHNSTWDDWWLEGERGGVDKQAERMVEAAWRITEDVWLPELLETLRIVRAPPSPADQLVVYRGGWRSHADCGASSLPAEDPSSTWDWSSPGDGPPPHALQPSLSKLLFRTRDKSQLVNSHTLFFNLQTIFQNYIARTVILPEFGIPFLDLESTLSVWRSGMVGGSASSPFEPVVGLTDQSGGGHGLGVGLRSPASGVCSRYCVPSPGSAIEEAFIGGLLRVFERGWAATRERREVWVGDDFVNVRERTAL